MGIRQAINENPKITGIVVGVCVLVAFVFIGRGMIGGHGARRGIGNAFYSDDDGKTYFVAKADNIPPFTDANGKTAVQAVVYRCGDGPPFVAYLMEFTKEGKERAERIKSGAESARSAGGRTIETEVKRPSAATWVKLDPDDAGPYTRIVTPVCPDGGGQRPRIVLPNR